MSTPMRRIRSACCARAVSGHAAAAPPSSVMTSRRLNRCSCIGPVSPGRGCRIPILRRSVSGEVRSTSVNGSNPGSPAFPSAAKSRHERSLALTQHLPLPSVGYDGQTSSAPLRKTVFQSTSFKSPRSQKGDRLIRENAIGTPAIGNDLLRGV